MLRIKVTTSFPEWPIIRQTPSCSGIWGECKFYINENIDQCDYWVVFEGLTKKESVICQKENTLLVTGEPPDIKKYNHNYISQFGHILTCHRDIKHPSIIYSQQGLPWMVGAEYDYMTNSWSNFRSFEEIKKMRIVKNKLLSAIVSKKLTTPGHKVRNQFIEHLIGVFGDKIDIFGVGHNPINDKWSAIAPYKYHLVLENSFIQDYWTEKLSDAFLGEALPIYCGCKNIDRYFSVNSIQTIDIHNFKISTEKIAETIYSDTYENTLSYIKSAKMKTLYEYNIFSILCDMVRKSNPVAGNTMNMISILPEKSYQ